MYETAPHICQRIYTCKCLFISPAGHQSDMLMNRNAHFSTSDPKKLMWKFTLWDNVCEHYFWTYMYITEYTLATCKCKSVPHTKYCFVHWVYVSWIFIIRNEGLEYSICYIDNSLTCMYMCSYLEGVSDWFDNSILVSSDQIVGTRQTDSPLFASSAYVPTVCSSVPHSL